MTETSFTIDPAWPWSEPTYGLPALAGIAVLLVLLTIWTYFGVRAASFGRIAVILTLRLAALLVAVTLVLRPSLASYKDDDVPPSKIIIVVDSSESMQFLDEFNNLSRWQNAQRILSSAAVTDLLKELGNRHKVEVLYYQAAESLGRFNPDGKAEGKRTDVGQWLHELLQKHGQDLDVRALLIIGDGANNGTKYDARDKAVMWRSKSPVHTFAAGRANTTLDLNDVALVEINVEPSPVPVKSEMKVIGTIDAPKFVNSNARVSLFIDGKPAQGKEPDKQVLLLKPKGNIVELVCDAPSSPGEVKVTLKVDTRPDEVTDFNNEISSYVNVTKDGVSVLWVEGKKRAFESVFARRHALSKDPRFRIFYTERVREAQPVQQHQDWFNFARQHYDVIVIGDISAERFAGGDMKVFAQIKDMVQNKGAGLMMLGGYETFGNSDWHTLPQAAPLVSLLPVTLTSRGQLEEPSRFVPRPEGLEHYLLRLDDNKEKNWNIFKPLNPDDPDGPGFAPLDGMTLIGDKKDTATVLAERDDNDPNRRYPLMVSGRVGEGRVLAFGGDTTWKAWRRNPEALRGYERFWKQTILWLAKQEEIEGNVWVDLDRRRLAADGTQRLGFSVGIQGKGGVNVKDARFQVRVIQPDKEATPVTVAPEGGEERGSFFPKQAGEHLIEVTGVGKDADGSDIRGTAKARFLAYAEDLEKLRPAADHEFLKNLAASGGGTAHRADERDLVEFLQTLVVSRKVDARAKPELWPDWRRNPTSKAPWDQIAALWNSAALGCFLIFTSLLCIEWFLRRRWGLV